MSEAKTFRLATLNIQHGSNGNYTDPGDPERVAEACRLLNADVLGLQEVDAGVPRSHKEDLAAYAAKACGMDYHFEPTRTYRGRGKVGIALLAKGEIKNPYALKLNGDWQRVQVGRFKIPVVPEPRKAIIAQAAIEGHEITTGVIHAGGRWRLEMLGITAMELRRNLGPHAFAGDYNVEEDNAREYLETFGFEVLEGGPTAKSEGSDVFDRHIDNIAIRGLHSLRAEAVDVPVGDHKAFVADLEIIKRR